MGIYPSLVTIILVVISVKRTQQAAITTDFTFSTIKRETNSDVNADSGVIISITDNAVTTNVPDTTTNDPHGTTTDTSGITSDHHGTTPESHRTTHGDTTHSDEAHGGSGHGRYPVVTFNFEHVAAPYVIALWVLLASLAKIGFHLQNRLASIFPESCMLIILGVLLGLIFFLVNGLHHSLFYTLDATTFFLFLLPPIILEAGYFMPTRAFFDNIGTILTFAVIGTLWNTFAIGLCLYGLIYGGVIDLNLGFLPCMVFSSLISAVDPVAVLAVFEEIHVNEVLYIVVFGESLLNDAVTVVLYHMFETYTEMGQEEVQAVDVISGTVSFFIVGIAGLLFGVMFGLLASFVTKFTSHVRVIEPVFVFVMAMLAYYSAEIFHFSGIMALIFCGISMKKYVEQNISAKSHTTVKYFMKMLSSIMETIIFMFLGLSTVTWNHAWNTGFVFFSLLFVFIFRFIGVLGLTAVCNHFRAIQINYVDQFIMGYGGLRGAIAFCLVILLDEKVIPEKQVLVTTTIVIVYFTNFAQGITIKPIVNLLRVKKQLKFKPSLNEEINGRLMDHTNAGIEDIVGTYGSSGIRER
ncbi:unnamed protein product [Owenia fusiformis]|uniref:Sodium/hydrogen exchanger n=1 Tax=Owenia fusiformis TaxID=6347 RepID=A0A8J1XQF0_OWEFU|nr:unnamed protein product [Owenia fusiformis]